MKILYAIQGTGNGHLSRSMDIVPCLEKHGEVDVVVSGIQGDLSLPFPVKYKFRGLSFIFGKTGGVSLWKTFAKTNFRRLRKEIKNLPVEKYDLVINDFEPVSAWACYFKNKPCISLSHQAAVLAPGAPRPDHEDMMGKLILNNYAPGTAAYGFHFTPDGNSIFTPVIRGQVREQQVADNGHYTVYLPSYDDKRLVKRLSAFKGIRWEVFSKHNKKTFTSGSITVRPINNEKFTRSMATSSGVLCGAGFETPAEALFLGKKVLVIPMKNQYEQHLNAAALRAMGVPVVRSLKPKHEPIILEWLEQDTRVAVNYPDITQQIIDMVVQRHGPAATTNKSPGTANGA
ncbi:glycosyltransferase family protein [uncultured Flavobacterium sp.]|uniref:glycosyltransferase family protein n=1 Tax=uncultured Flavobacterium sp. TaxID=165435 RepID=UPI0025CDC3D7|nr:glycosyltransferase family protein [uncultured Flavobacterium sp.]